MLYREVLWGSAAGRVVKKCCGEVLEGVLWRGVVKKCCEEVLW